MGLILVVPPPLPPRDLAGLSEEELRNLEGTTREAIEARIRMMRQIVMMLDSASLMASQVSAAIPPSYPTQTTRSIYKIFLFNLM
jgi:E3 ubiquitin-protein ligase synoviolin